MNLRNAGGQTKKFPSRTYILVKHTDLQGTLHSEEIQTSIIIYIAVSYGACVTLLSISSPFFLSTTLHPSLGLLQHDRRRTPTRPLKDGCVASSDKRGVGLFAPFLRLSAICACLVTTSREST